MKKIFSVLITLMLAMTMLFSACSSPAPSQSTPTSESGASTTGQADKTATQEPAESVTLKAIWTTGGFLRAIEPTMQDFTAKTGIKFESVAPSYQEGHEKQLIELSSGSSDVDVVAIDGPIWLTEQYKYLEPLTDYIARDNVDMNKVVPAFANMSKYDGVMYSMPFRIGGWVLMYRRDLLEAKGLSVPQSMQELRSAAIALTDGDLYGFTAPLKQTNYLICQWCPFLYSWGGSFLTEDNKTAAFNSDAGKKSLQFFVDLFVKDKVISPAALDYENDGVLASMQAGNAAMAITYSPYFLDMNNKEKSEFAGNFAVSPTIPYVEGSGMKQGMTEISGWGIAINKNSKNKDAAWEFLKFLGSEEEQLKLATENSNSPVVKSVFESDAYKKIYPDSGAVLNALIGAKYRPGIAKWAQVEEILSREVSAAMSEIKTVEQALADAERDVNNVLSK